MARADVANANTHLKSCRWAIEFTRQNRRRVRISDCTTPQRSSEQFSKLKRIWPVFVEAHLGRDTLFNLMRGDVRMLFGRGSEEKLHTRLYAEPLKNFPMELCSPPSCPHPPCGVQQELQQQSVIRTSFSLTISPNVLLFRAHLGLIAREYAAACEIVHTEQGGASSPPFGFDPWHTLTPYYLAFFD